MKAGLVPFFVFLLALASAGVVLAQESEEAPPPYSGIENPFPWEDEAAREAGQRVYQQCTGCHGVAGDSLKEFDFSTEEYAQDLEENPDYYFWILSEGRLDKGMPPYKSSLSEEERWQSLTYIWSLSKVPETPPEDKPPVGEPPAEVKGNILLVMPQEARAGQQLSLSATVRDEQDQPVRDAEVTFFIEADFFAQDLMEIGTAVTDEEGAAILEYVPRRSGELVFVTRLQNLESRGTVHVLEPGHPLYETEVGIHFPQLNNEEIILGPESARELGPMGQAPTSGLRLSGGGLNFFLLLPLLVFAIWFAYFKVIRVISGIPIPSEIRDIDTRLVPYFVMAAVVTLGLLLLAMLVTGPFSHFHLM